jgi:hypothetical protein
LLADGSEDSGPLEAFLASSSSSSAVTGSGSLPCTSQRPVDVKLAMYVNQLLSFRRFASTPRHLRGSVFDEMQRAARVAAAARSRNERAAKIREIHSRHLSSSSGSGLLVGSGSIAGAPAVPSVWNHGKGQECTLFPSATITPRPTTTVHSEHSHRFADCRISVQSAVIDSARILRENLNLLQNFNDINL